MFKMSRLLTNSQSYDRPTNTEKYYVNTVKTRYKSFGYKSFFKPLDKKFKSSLKNFNTFAIRVFPNNNSYNEFLLYSQKFLTKKNTLKSKTNVE